MPQYRTSRGFAVYADFEDMNGKEFTIQESSLATERCVWVGKEGSRGHLNEDQARQVRDALTEFLEERISDKRRAFMESLP